MSRRTLARPRQHELAALLRDAGANAVAAAELLEALVTTWPERPELAAQLRDREHEGDRITHDALHCLRRSYALGFARDDGIRLVGAVDDVVDLIEEAADHLVGFKVEAPMDQAVSLSAILRDACRELAAVLAEIEHPGSSGPRLARIGELEHEGDRVVRSALAALFEQSIDPLFVIRWKDILERLEEAIDSCKTAANVLETIRIKHG